MPGRTLITSILLALSLLAFAPVAAAKKSVPPGDSGADQYTEGVPGLGGDVPTGSNGGGSSSPTGSAPGLSATTQAELAAAGAEGAALAAIVAETRPNSGPRSDAAAGGEAQLPGSSLDLAELAAAGDGEGGMGLALPLILAALALSALVAAAVRARQG